jgi:iron complex outermembrane receptor protein
MDRDEDNLDGSINLQYDFSDVGNVYVSWARGSKSGGFTTNVDVPENAEFETEEAETAELGLKTEFLNGSARFNAALFYTEIDNFQSVRFVGDGFVTETLPVESQGIEFDTTWAATENLLLALSATYADAEQTDTGEKPAGAPELTASFNLSHRANLGASFELRTSASVNYRDEMFTQGGETYEVPSLTLVDLRLGLAPTDGNWELALLARNLFDEQEDVFGFDFPLFGDFYETGLGSYNRPRTVSLQARYDF